MSEEIEVEWIIVQINGRFIINYEFEAPSVGVHDDSSVITFIMADDESYAKRFYDDEEDRLILETLRKSKDDDNIVFFYAYRDKSLNEIRYYPEIIK